MNQLRSLSRFPEFSGKNRTLTAFLGHFRTAVAFSGNFSTTTTFAGGFWTITAFSGGIGTLRDSIMVKNGPRMPDVSGCRPETYARVQIGTADKKLDAGRRRDGGPRMHDRETVGLFLLARDDGMSVREAAAFAG
ncbi:hypothetical protein, partial [Enorma massiliensis]|uniref:hypothetical protein n=1 Tax=Enorma massiliensis TaxID=1472761 RepID=UPI003A900F58